MSGTKKPIRLAVTALSGRIIAGKPNASNTAILEGSRHDVTSDFMKALIDKAQFHGGTFIIEGNGRKWEATVKEVTPQAPTTVPRGEQQ